MSFDRIAWCYQALEYAAFGHLLERCRRRHLDRVRNARRVLILGEGDGRFLERFLQVNRIARVDCVEGSRGMVRVARKRLAHRRATELDRVVFHEARAEEWSIPEAIYDAIVTHFFLDCFDSGQLRVLTSRIASGARNECVWLHSDFQVPASGWRRRRGKALIAFLYAFFRYAAGLRTGTAEPVGEHLGECGFSLTARETYSWELLTTEAWRREDQPRGGSSTAQSTSSN